MSLPELLIVIAIIGILASVVMASFSGARATSREKSARSLALVAQSSAYSCVVRDVEINPPVAGDAVCTLASGTQNKWPALPPGWSYGASTSNYSSRTFSFSITDGTRTATCNQNGCS